MRWSCPHCGIQLAIADEKFGPGWSFSRCYQCAGFGLVRRTGEVNVIKVDKAPAGDNVLLPEASEEVRIGVMSQEATDRLREYTERHEARKAATQAHLQTKEAILALNAPVIRPAARRGSEASRTDLAAPAAVSKTQSTFIPPGLPAGLARPSLRPSAGSPAVAAPLKSPINNPVNNLMRNAVPPAPPAAAMAAAAAPVAKKFPEPLPAVPPLSSIARLQGKVRPMPMAMLLAAVMTLGSGGYLYFQARILMKKARLANTSQHHGAHSTVQPVSLQTPAPIVDQVHSAAMAPERPVIMETPILAPTAPAPSRGRGMVVSALINHVKLHSGPGLQFPVTGYIDADTHYHVIDWRDRWFRIALRGSEGGTAWVRNDVVKLIH